MLCAQISGLLIDEVFPWTSFFPDGTGMFQDIGGSSHRDQTVKGRTKSLIPDSPINTTSEQKLNVPTDADKCDTAMI